MKNRRSFLARVSAISALFGLASASADAQTAAPSGRWQALRDPKDGWYDQIPGKRRIFFDVTSPPGVVDGAMFAGNFFNGNKNGYGLEGVDLAVLVGFRHNATCFGFNDAMWAKYGAALSDAAGPWEDPKTRGPATTNGSRATPSGRGKPR